MVSRRPVSVLLVCCIVLIYALAQGVASDQTRNNSTKLQARISLETKNLDIDDKSLDGLDSSISPTPASNHSLTASDTTTTTAKPKRKKVLKKSERANRRLTNLWSMFMPSSSASNTDSDYEEATEESEALTDTSLASNHSQDPLTSENPIANLDHVGSTTSDSLDPEKHDERLVAKYSRPPRQDAGQVGGSNELTLVSPSSASQPVGWSATPLIITTTTTARPVQLITGAMVGNDTFGPAPQSDREQEDDERGVSVAPAVTGSNRTSESSSNFERWLSRIQFHDQSSLTTSPQPADATRTESGVADMRQQDIFKLAPLHQALDNSSEPKVSSFSAYKWANAMRPHRQSGQAAKKAPQTGVKGLVQRSPQQSTKTTGVLQFQRYQHPIQQHLMRQKVGIRNPSAQASTISVSTQEGASNTSLSLAQNLDMLNSLRNELGPVPNSTSGSSETGFEQSQIQSQDEILRQVTNTINFEQQLDQKSPSNGVPEAGNHKKQAEPEPGKLFKVGTSINELASEASTTAPSIAAPPNATATSPQLDLLKAKLGAGGLLDLDSKTWDLLAEKLRAQGAAPPQGLESNASSQPSWLRRPEFNLLQSANNALLAGGNLTRLASLLAGDSQKQVALEKMRELLSKHEKNKNELKSSQESMSLLLNQMMLENEAKKQNITPVGLQTSAGWTPMSQPPLKGNFLNPLPPLSPGNIVKGKGVRPPPPPFRLSHAEDNAGLLANNLANSNQYLDELAMIMGNSPANDELLAHYQQELLGLPLGELKLPLSNDDLLGNSLMAKHYAAAAGQLPPHTSKPLIASNQMATRLGHPVEQNAIKGADLNEQNRHHLSQFHRVKGSQPLQSLTQRLPPQHNAFQFPVTGGPKDHSPIMPPTHQLQPFAGAQMLAPEAALAPGGDNHTAKQVDLNSSLGSQYIVSRPQDKRPSLLINSASGLSRLTSQQRLPAHELHRAHQPDAADAGSLAASAGHGDDEFRMQRQAQQQIQQQVLAPGRTVVMIGRNPYMAVPPYPLRQIFRPPQPPIVATNSGLPPAGEQALPIRLREVSVYRPSGYESHHAFAYQASPAVAALFPGLAQPAPRTTLIRNMGPFRARFSESQLVPHQQVAPSETMARQQLALAGHHTQFPYGHSLVDAMREQYMRRGQMRRQSPSPMGPADAWPQLPSSKVPLRNRLKLRHLDLSPEDQQLIDNELDLMHLDGFVQQSGVDEEDELAMMQQHSHLVPRIDKMPPTVTLRVSRHQHQVGNKTSAPKSIGKPTRSSPRPTRTCESPAADPIVVDTTTPSWTPGTSANKT